MHRTFVPGYKAAAIASLVTVWSCLAIAQPSPKVRNPDVAAIYQIPILCPSLINGHRAPLTSPEISDRELSLDTTVAVPAPLAKTAMDIVGRFESGGADPFVGVSSQERVSIGFMQWNWVTGSLLSPFIKNLDDSTIALAPKPLLADLKTLRDVARGDRFRSDASAVIDRWTSPADGDVLIGGIRTTVRANLKTWLGTDVMRSYQQTLVDRELRKAYALASAWRRDTGAGGQIRDVDGRLLASFFDLVTFNGDRAGLWVKHVQDFRLKYDQPRKVIDVIGEWLQICNNTFYPSARNKKMYGRIDGIKNANYWHSLFDLEGTKPDNDQLDLLSFGFLRAQLSTGDDKPRGFPGIYQANVMVRRGTIALGRGFVNGSPQPLILF